MPTTVETTVYRYDELSESAQGRARDGLRRSVASDFDPDNVLDDAATIAELLGIELATRPVRLMGGGTRRDPVIHYSLAYSQGDGASFAGRYRYSKGAAEAVRAHAPQDAELARIADALQAIQRRHFYGLVADVTARDAQSYTMRIADCEDSAGRAVPPDVEDSILGELRAFADWMFHAIRNEYEYQTSDEALADTLRDGEYTFTDDGRAFA